MPVDVASAALFTWQPDSSTAETSASALISEEDMLQVRVHDFGIWRELYIGFGD
jgi:hypothetical protein